MIVGVRAQLTPLEKSNVPSAQRMFPFAMVQKVDDNEEAPAGQ